MIHPDELLNRTKVSSSASGPKTMMKMRSSPLDDLRVASPCHASWARMRGDGRVRFCESCKLNVYNLSGMDRDQAENLVAATEGRLCVRFYQGPDGTVLTRDCPVGLAAVRKRLAIAIGLAVALFVYLLSWLLRKELAAPTMGIPTMEYPSAPIVLPPPQHTMGAVGIPIKRAPVTPVMGVPVAPTMGKAACVKLPQPEDASLVSQVAIAPYPDHESQ